MRYEVIINAPDEQDDEVLCTLGVLLADLNDLDCEVVVADEAGTLSL